MNTRYIGAGVEVAGAGLKGNLCLGGGAKQEIGVYIMFDTDKMEIGIGGSYTQTITESNLDVTLGPINTSTSTEKTETLDANTTNGYSASKDTSYKEKESVSYAGLNKSADGTLSTSIDVSANLLILGIEAKAEVKVEEEPKNVKKINQ